MAAALGALALAIIGAAWHLSWKISNLDSKLDQALARTEDHEKRIRKIEIEGCAVAQREH